MLVLTFAPCACGGCHCKQLTVLMFLPQPLAQRLHLQPQWFHPLQLVPVVYLILRYTIIPHWLMHHSGGVPLLSLAPKNISPVKSYKHADCMDETMDMQLCCYSDHADDGHSGVANEFPLGMSWWLSNGKQ